MLKDGEVFVVKYANLGQQLWNRTWGGPNSDEARDIVVDSLNNIYVNLKLM